MRVSYISVLSPPTITVEIPMNIDTTKIAKLGYIPVSMIDNDAIMKNLMRFTCPEEITGVNIEWFDHAGKARYTNITIEEINQHYKQITED